MGTQTMNSRIIGGGHPTTRNKSWFTRTLAELRDQLGDLGKPLGSTKLDELIKIVWTAESSCPSSTDTINANSYAALQASLSLANAFSGKTVDEVWRDIQQESNKMKNLGDMHSEEREPTLLEMTFEDFLVKAGIYIADASLGPVMSLDSAINLNNHNFPPQIGSPSPSSPSIDVLSDTSTLEKRLRRKIKNRESAARSRARKEAYHNELESKVSFLEERNAKLRKEKLATHSAWPFRSAFLSPIFSGPMALAHFDSSSYDAKVIVTACLHKLLFLHVCILDLFKEFEQMISCNYSEPRYQLRRTTSL
ncbi:abscisic acid-insensitive 5-like protein 2 [Phtheirospermum japonicum]|uniref:Abscisic acid-insensitive 5-like protein 2 n=1 Tax=Phtheirospermum japonicum TaxID=374723 RepID=A0A830CB27_9LAMI|nr:abscisic acid-insensitive 5-like protein 2 [Phtheirospermum japonicum]